MGILGWRARGGKADLPMSRPTFAESLPDKQSYASEDLTDPVAYQHQAERYSRSDLVYMCIRRVSDMAAGYSKHLHLFDPTGSLDPVTMLPEEEIEGHPFAALWDKPNAWMSSFDFTEAVVTNLLLNGNAYIHLDDGAEPKKDNQGVLNVGVENEPIAMWVLRPDRIRPVPDKKSSISGYQYEVDGNKVLFQPISILHIKLFHPMRDYEGMSPIEAANNASLSDIQAQRTNLAVFKNSMRLSAVVESEQDRVDPEQVKLMKKYLLETYTGDPDKAHQVAFLWSQFKLRELGMNMRDAEFIEGQKLNRMRIFGVFGVHPGIVLSEDVNMANAKVGEYTTLKYTVGPMLERVANGITRMAGNVYAGQPLVEAHFVGIVPEDDAAHANIALTQAQATQALIMALGPEEGIKEAVRQGLVDDDVDASAVPNPAQTPFGPFPAG